MANCKGIILAGGTGSRLFPVTIASSKQLLPVYDKPMIYYPLSVLMLAEIRDILIVINGEDLDRFKYLLGDGSQFGISITYAVQTQPRGIPDAFLIGEKFIGNSRVALILGDNLFYGPDFSSKLIQAKEQTLGANIFSKFVSNPSDFGILELDKNNKPISIAEKPKDPKSNFAVTGLYFYDNSVIEISKNLIPSSRGELEITDVNNIYLRNNMLDTTLLGRGFAWLDTGSPDSLIDAGLFVQTIEKQQGHKIACLEEIAYSKKWITDKTLLSQADKLKGTKYSNYLKNLLA
jgi:glucose-1-phosphate thymidylyltransferase